MLRQITGCFPADPQDEKVLAIDKRIPAAYPYHSPPCPGLLQHLRAPLQQGGACDQSWRIFVGPIRQKPASGPLRT